MNLMNATIENFRLRARIADLECKLRQQKNLIEKQKKIIEFSRKEVESCKKTIKYGEEQQEISGLQAQLDEKISELISGYQQLLEDWERESEVKPDGQKPKGG